MPPDGPRIQTEPTPAQMLEGELAVNYNQYDPALYIKGADKIIYRVDGNQDTYSLGSATVTEGAQIDLTHDPSGTNAATTDSVILLKVLIFQYQSQVAQSLLPQMSLILEDLDIGQETMRTNTLSPVNANDNVDIGSGTYTGSTLQAESSALTLQTVEELEIQQVPTQLI